MAKEFTFESEQTLKRQKLKRILIPIGALLLIVGATVLIAVIVAKNRPVRTGGGEDTPYPYTWSVKKNGTAELVVDTSEAPGYQWVPDSETESALFKMEEKQRSGRESVFTLTPQTFGTEELEFFLQKGEDTANRIYTLKLLVNIPQKETEEDAYAPELLTALMTAISAPAEGGQDTDFPYVIRTEKGCLIITMQDKITFTYVVGADLPDNVKDEIPDDPEYQPEETEPETAEASIMHPDWELISDHPEAVLVSGPELGDFELTAKIIPGQETGSANISIRSASAQTELLIAAEHTADGAVLLKSHELKDYQPPETEAAEETTEETTEESTEESSSESESEETSSEEAPESQSEGAEGEASEGSDAEGSTEEIEEAYFDEVIFPEERQVDEKGWTVE